MFTGIIHALAHIKRWHPHLHLPTSSGTTAPTAHADLQPHHSSHQEAEALLEVCLAQNPSQLAGLEPKDSVSVHGICLTVVQVLPQKQAVIVGIGSQTQSITDILQHADRGMEVHFERALKMGEEFGGHSVQGHIHTQGILTAITPKEHGDHLLTFRVPDPDQHRYMIPRSYVALNGVSLTIAQCHQDTFTINLIPETGRRTLFLCPHNPLSIQKGPCFIEWDHVCVTVVQTTERLHGLQQRSVQSSETDHH